MMKKINLFMMSLAVVLLMGAPVYAQTQCATKEHNNTKKQDIYKELNLTPQQQEKLEANRKAQREEMSKLQTALKENRRKLQEELKNPAVTREAVEPLLGEMKSLQGQLTEQRISGIFAVKEILTAEQFTRFQQMLDKRQENGKDRFKQWHERKKSATEKQE